MAIEKHIQYIAESVDKSVREPKPAERSRARGLPLGGVKFGEPSWPEIGSKLASAY
ncbi:hypothetical protein J6590_042223 [Homalodisca vitripennis]|nr:hypothetical protein J6590_042223 [Homalodisca vitripennis]